MLTIINDTLYIFGGLKVIQWGLLHRLAAFKRYALVGCTEDFLIDFLIWNFFSHEIGWGGGIWK